MNIRRLSGLLAIVVIAAGMIGSAMMPVNALSKPSKVTGVKVTMAANDSISLKWSKAKGARKYEVQYRLSASKKWKSKKTSAKMVKLTGLKAGRKYSIRVRALNGSIRGAFSKTISQKTYIKPDAVDSDSVYTSMRNNRGIQLKWDPAANASWYEIFTQELNSDGLADIQNCDYEEYEENKYRPLTEYTSRIRMRQNTWYEFKIRSVNSRTGKFPALKSAWTKSFYACTVAGDRLITGRRENRIIVYELKGTFDIGVDDALVPRKIYEREDPTENWYESDVMYCDAVSFPEDFASLAEHWGYTIDDSVSGKTYTVGSDYKGEIIESLIIEPCIEERGALVISIRTKNGGGASFIW